MKASILIVGHPHPDTVDFGADHAAHYEEALDVLKNTNYAVIVAAHNLPQSGAKTIKTSYDFLSEAKKLSADSQAILIGENLKAQDLQKAINLFRVFKTLNDFDDIDLQIAVREALEEYELIKQNQAFLTLTQEQNLRLQHLTNLLEDKVKAREKFLIEIREKLINATKRNEALNRGLVAIQKSITKQDIERNLNDALKQVITPSWTKILYRNESFIESLAEHTNEQRDTIFSAPLFREHDLLGHIYFARSFDKPFTTEEDDFLLQISDAVGLAIDRLMALEATESLKQEWDSTFDSISAPVSLIDEEYNIVRANKNYASRSNIALDQIVGEKCYRALFNQNEPCKNCNLGTSFDLGETLTNDKAHTHFAVSSHRVQLEGNQKTIALFYRDVSEEQRIQRQILESSKMAEIGTIGSSIAHEINNPLGGMIAFLQILKSSTKSDSPHYSDIIEMEQAAIRCKTIVENLLAFTRQSEGTEKKLVSVAELFRLSSNIMELQTRALGIKLVKQMDKPDTKMKGDINQLVQVLVNTLQNSCEAIADRYASGVRTPPGEIVLSSHLSPSLDHVLIEIKDNGLGISQTDLSKVFTPFFTTKDKNKNAGLGLSVSYQIVKEHEGQMEISSNPGQLTTVTITLPVAKSPIP